MANIKITDLVALTDPATTDVLPVVDIANDETKKVAVGEIVGKISGDVDVATDGASSIASGVIVDADVNASAAIAGTKINPDFGSQNVTTTGTVTGASLTPTSSVVPTNGVYLPNTNQVGVATNGTGRLFVQSDGRVSVGTGSASANVHSQAASNQFLARDSATNDSLFLSVDNGVAEFNSFLSNTGRMPIRFMQYTTEVARFDSSGRVGIGTTSPSYQLQLSTDSAGKPSTNTWTIVSDERIKDDIELADLDICYDAVKNIPLKRFKWKDEVYTEEQVPDRHKIGWIAQDVEAVFPKAVRINEFKYGEEGQEVVIDDCRDLNADQLYAAMYGTIQKLIAKVETLEAEVAAFKAQ